MNRILTALLRGALVTAALAVAGLAGAQNALHEAAFSLSTPEYRADLGLSESQDGKVADILKTYSREQQAIARHGGGSATETALDRLDVEYADKLIQVLTAPQKSRLRQIALQNEGPSAIAHADVAQELGLSAEQRSKVAALASAARQKQDDFDAELGSKIEAVPAPKTKTASAMKAYDAKKNAIFNELQPQQKRVTAFKAESDSKILAALTSAQRSKWQGMLGKKFSG